MTLFKIFQNGYGDESQYAKIHSFLSMARDLLPLSKGELKKDFQVNFEEFERNMTGALMLFREEGKHSGLIESRGQFAFRLKNDVDQMVKSGQVTESARAFLLKFISAVDHTSNAMRYYGEGKVLFLRGSYEQRTIVGEKYVLAYQELRQTAEDLNAFEKDFPQGYPKPL
jgi:hypothetical protein